MGNSDQSVKGFSPQQFISSLPFLLAVVVLVFVGYGIGLSINHPSDGIRGMSHEGYISEVDLAGPSINILKVGDTVIAVDNIPLEEAIPFYLGKQAGDEVRFTILRDNIILTVPVHLAKPTLSEFIRRMMPLLVALIFWGVGVGVRAFSPSTEATNLCLLFFLGMGTLLTAGQISNVGPSWISNLYNYLLWFVGPLGVYFHLFFPQNTVFRGRRWLIASLFFISLLGGMPYLLWGTQVVGSSPWATIFLTGSRLFIVLNLCLTVLFLFYAYRHEVILGTKGKIRIVLLGGVITTFPLVMLTFLPEAIFHQPIQPYEFVFLWLGVMPLTYGFAIFRYHIIEFESHINRGATYILVFSLLGGIYLFLYSIISRFLPANFSTSPFINTVLVLFLASIIVPLFQRIKKIVDTLFYGGYYDYRSAITQITGGLHKTTDLHILAQTISERLVRTLHVEDTCVFLSDTRGDFSIIDVAPHDKVNSLEPPHYPVLPRSSLEYLLKVGEADRASLAKSLSEVTLSPEEHQLLNSEQIHLWVPIIGYGEVKGLLALGPKLGGDIFSAEDMDILRVVAQQIGTILENIHLLNQLKQHAAELEARVVERTAQLHDAKERVEAILAGVGDGVFVIDLDEKILTVNKALEGQSGYRAVEIIGNNTEILFAKENNPTILEEIRSALLKGEVWIGELVNKKKNGIKYDVQLTIAPVRDQHGEIVSFVGSQRDITQRKELERLKDIFIADVSHELRTPTTNINLYLELLESAPPEKHPEYLEVLKVQSQLLRKLVEDILDLSRLTINKSKKTDFLPVDIELIIEQVITAHLPMAEAAGLRLNYLAGKNILPILGDASQLARVVTNLVSNAINYTGDGEVGLCSYMEEGRVFIEVSDTGIGIEDEDLQHIFERFYRGRQVRQTKAHGTGLGLAIVKEIVELHGGDIRVFTKPGEGSRFVVSLPVYSTDTD